MITSSEIPAMVAGRHAGRDEELTQCVVCE